MILSMRIAVAGGGTGGHVFPIQSLIKYHNNILDHNHSFIWFGEKPSLEYTVYQSLHSDMCTFVPIRSGKWRREKGHIALRKNMRDLGNVCVGILQSLYGLISHKCDVVFCKGGYVSLPVVIAGWILRKKIFLHESDTKPGLANRLCSIFAHTIFTGFAGVFPGREVVIGQILDDDLVTQKVPIETHNKSVHILVTGGSQGAESMYRVVASLVPRFPGVHFHIVLGTKNIGLQGLFNHYKHCTTYDFVNQATMGGLLSLCNIAITRGGTTSLAEQELYGLHKIIVPIPRTHDQYKNAIYYRDHHGDDLIDQESIHFESNMFDAIQHHISYQKKPHQDMLHMVQKAKKIIFSSIESI